MRFQERTKRTSGAKQEGPVVFCRLWWWGSPEGFRLFDIVEERKRNAGGGVLAVRGNTDESER